jgi:hypothetical protein
MSLSASDMTRIARLNASKTYAINGQVQTKDLVSNVLPNSMANNMSFVGKLKTSRETSKIIDFRASQSADYVLVRQNAGANEFAYGRQLLRTKICNTVGNCTSILVPRVIVRF